MSDDTEWIRKYLAARAEASRRLGEVINRGFYELMSLYRSNGQPPAVAAQFAIKALNRVG